MNWRLVAAIVAINAPEAVQADSVELIYTGMSTSTAVQMGDTTVTARGAVGALTVSKSSGGLFQEGQSGLGRFAGMAKKSPRGFELEADGVIKVGDVVAGSSGQGSAHITGSGKYSSLNIDCPYSVVGLPENVSVTILRCTW